MIKVEPLVGFQSYLAFQGYHKLILGLKMLPEYIGEQYEDFYDRVEQMPHEDQIKLIKKAAVMVELEKSELEHIASFVKDPNGIPYGRENMKSLPPNKIIDIITAVCAEISKIEVDFLSREEKKNLKDSQ